MIRRLDTFEQLRRLVDDAKPYRPPEAVTPINWAALDGIDPPPRVFAWRNWLPTKCVTALYAPGGLGKSLLAQQLATSTAKGLPFLGEETDGRPALCIFCEEDEPELWRRQVRITAHLGLRLRELDGRVYVDARAGKPNVLAKFGYDGTLIPGELVEPLRRALEEIRPGTLVLDNIAQLFNGDENNRAHVTQFINYLTSLAMEFNCAILLIGHTNKQPNANYSGSTAWNAAVRCRLLLHQDEQTKKITLKREKSNYAPPAEVELVWAKGLLCPANPEIATMSERIELETRRARIREAFLEGLEILRSRGLATSANVRAPTYAPRFLPQQDVCRDYSVRELEDAMRELLKDGRLRADVKVVRGSNRSWRIGLGRPEWEQTQACGNGSGEHASA